MRYLGLDSGTSNILRAANRDGFVVVFEGGDVRCLALRRFLAAPESLSRRGGQGHHALMSWHLRVPYFDSLEHGQI